MDRIVNNKEIRMFESTLKIKKRQREILPHIEKEYTTGELWNKVKPTYTKCYKTFQRDIKQLNKDGHILTKVLNGGTNGTTTKIKRVENHG